MKTYTPQNLTKIAAEFEMTVESNGDSACDGYTLTFADEDNGILVRATLFPGAKGYPHRLVDSYNRTLALYYTQQIIDANPCMPKEKVYSMGRNGKIEQAMRLACEWLTKNS